MNNLTRLHTILRHLVCTINIAKACRIENENEVCVLGNAVTHVLRSVGLVWYNQLTTE